jgi:hypothetical protein
MKTWCLLLSLFFFTTASSQNLLVNPSAESGDPISVGWTKVSMGTTGASCSNSSGWRIIQLLNSFPAAQQGFYFFFAGCGTVTGTTYEIYQDVNVSLNAGLIDMGWNSFTFSGYTQSYPQSPPDQAEIIVEYRNAANTTVLTSYNTGFTANTGGWVLYTNTTIAPVGTRFIRVRLISKLRSGGAVDGYFDNLSLTTSIPLPVVISSFNVIPENSDVKLVWATATETDNSYFTVQRSQNGSDWNDLGEVQSKTNGGPGSTYTFYDKNPVDGVLYYRLKQTDLTGRSTFSEIKEIDFANSFTDITLFPNPARGSFTLKGDNLNKMQFSLYNNIGQMILLPGIALSKTITFNTTGLTKGMYFLRLTDTHITEIRKIVVE